METKMSDDFHIIGQSKDRIVRVSKDKDWWSIECLIITMDGNCKRKEIRVSDDEAKLMIEVWGNNNK